MYPNTLFQKIIQIVTADDPVIRFSLVAICVLLIAFNFQGMLISSIKRDMKKFGRDVWNISKRRYLQLAWIGWIFVLMGITAIEGAVLKITFLVNEDQFEIGILGGALLVLFGVLINFRNFFKCYITTLKEKLH